MADTDKEARDKRRGEKKARDEELEEGLEESFPASDPPASTRPGENEPVPSSGYEAEREKRDRGRS